MKFEFRMLFGCKLFFVIFLFSSSSASLLPKESKVSVTDLKLKKLMACLTSSGVDAKNVHLRNSGSAYTELNFQWNTLNGYLQPLVYLVATAVSDIQKAVVCAKLSKVHVVPRSGGHSYVKNGFGDSRSLIVDLAKLNQISVDPTQMTCEISPGARNGLISYSLWEKGFIVAQGICPTVGIGGLALGGGYGHFPRLLGLTSDNVIEMEMVDAKGKLLKINNSTNKDLFWALRGGGGGNFGIVSKFKLKIHPAPWSIAYGTYEYSFKDFEVFFQAYQSLVTACLPDTFFTLLEIERNLIKFKVTAFNGQHRENSVSVNGVESLQKLFNFPVATKRSTKLLTHSEFMLTEAQLYSNTVLTHPSQMANMTKHFRVGWKKVKSFYVGKMLNKKQISKLNKLVSTYVQSAGLNIEFYGGAVNDVSPSKTAFVHRDKNLYHVQLKPFNSQDERPNSKADAAMKTFYEESKALFHHQESYQNYLDQDIRDYLTRYYGPNLKKLVQVKRRVDPENVFHHPQSIPVDFVKIY